MEYLFNKVAGLLWGPFSGLQKNNYKKLFHKNVMLRYQTQRNKKMQKGLREVKTVRSFCIWQISASQLPNIFTRKGIIRLLRTQNFFEKRTCAYQGLEKLVFRKFRVRTKWIVPKCRRLELTQFKRMRNKVCSLLLTL